MPYIGEGRIYYGEVAPSGWVFAGSLLSQEQFPGLYSVMGDKWGDAETGYFYAGNSDIFLRVCPSAELLGQAGGENTQQLALANLPAYEQLVGSGSNSSVLAWNETLGDPFSTVPVFRYVNIIIYTGVGGTPEIEESNALIAEAIEFLAGILSYLIGNQG